MTPRSVQRSPERLPELLESFASARPRTVCAVRTDRVEEWLRPAERRVDPDDVRAFDILHQLVVRTPKERRADLWASARPLDAARRRAGVLHGEVDADGMDGAQCHG